MFCDVCVLRAIYPALNKSFSDYDCGWRQNLLLRWMCLLNSPITWKLLSNICWGSKWKMFPRSNLWRDTRLHLILCKKQLVMWISPFTSKLQLKQSLVELFLPPSILDSSGSQPVSSILLAPDRMMKCGGKCGLFKCQDATGD